MTFVRFLTCLSSHDWSVTGLFEGVSKDKWKVFWKICLFFLATSLGGGGVIVITAVHPYNVVKKDHQHHPGWGNSDTDPLHFLVLCL